MKKKIAIPGWSTGDSSWGVTKPYLEFFSQYGQVEILTPREEIVECDLLVLPGGMDLPSQRYGEVPGFYNSSIDAYKYYFYEKNLPKYIEAGIPIYGICLGHQMLCTYFGGKLTQNMYHPYSNRDRSELVHEIHRVIGFDGNGVPYLDKNNKKNTLKVNSLHHQAIAWWDMGEQMKPTYLDEDGVYVEIAEHATLPIASAQLHPEELGYFKPVDLQIKKLLKLNKSVEI